MPKYTNQIVIFIDILGFSNMLPGFEQEALENSIHDDDEFHESPSLNRLIEIFKDSINLIKDRNCNYYLFSDNICITIDYVIDGMEHPELFVEILQLLNILNYEFIREGYFIRGGVDAGWFLDSRDMAAGVPLLEAYRLESKVAIHPRIMISSGFRRRLKEMQKNNQFSEEQEILLNYILKSDNHEQFINAFMHIQNFEDTVSKKEFLLIYRDKIADALTKFEGNEYIQAKYKWTAKRFNDFLDEYINDQPSLELEGTWDEEELKAINELKIN